jgi:hypothetical protein
VLDSVVAPVVQVLDPVLESVVAPVVDVLNPVLETVAVASPGSIVFQDAPAAGSAAPDDLFAGGGYTDYNLALQTGISLSLPSPGAILLDTAAQAEESLSAITANATSSEQGGQGNAQPIAIPSVLEEMGLRGLGDGLGL